MWPCIHTYSFKVSFVTSPAHLLCLNSMTLFVSLSTAMQIQARWKINSFHKIPLYICNWFISTNQFIRFLSCLRSWSDKLALRLFHTTLFLTILVVHYWNIHPLAIAKVIWPNCDSNILLTCLIQSIHARKPLFLAY